ncbi:1-acyl-sn-glycerol-3-phosphate acyltransferase [Frondihabitans sp. PAMC 28766]|uniref:lysophospholipid acyltransferase family protein n=1 Tax=Frondihabitans sp. PAMC 28766 TaxID=1795630 RepID=UPI000A70946E|nr:lysophospholipid acyltransferase family protein [Frondihabitans sp. PAMC 28766]
MTTNPDAPLAPSPKRIREHNLTFGVLGRLAMPLLVAQAKYTVRDADKLPATGPFVVTPNHYSNYDPLIVGVILFRLGRVPRFLAKSSLWKVPVLKWIMRSTGQVPVDRTGRTRGADPIESGGAALARGEGVIVYPEGSLTREPDMWPMRGKSGAVRLALATGVPLIPMAQWGAQDILGRDDKIHVFPRKRVRAAFGDPVDLSAYRGRHLDQHELMEATALVMRRITELLAEIRGGTPPERLYDPAEHNQTEIGRFEP